MEKMLAADKIREYIERQSPEKLKLPQARVEKAIHAAAGCPREVALREMATEREAVLEGWLLLLYMLPWLGPCPQLLQHVR